MIYGNKPSGYFVTFDKSDKKIEGETRMCVHCQYKWIYKMGQVKVRRGWCNICKGILCGKDLCMRYHIPYIDKIEGIEKGLNFKDLLKVSEKKYGNKLIGETKII